MLLPYADAGVDEQGHPTSLHAVRLVEDGLSVMFLESYYTESRRLD